MIIITDERPTLTAQRVYETFSDCLFDDGEDATNPIITKGIMINVEFHPGRLKQHRQEIRDMLAELPREFMKTGGGGYSFLNACMDRHGNQWTGSHQTQEQLVQLGIAIGEVEYCLPRELWGVLPGSVPYFVVNQ